MKIKLTILKKIMIYSISPAPNPNMIISASQLAFVDSL